VVNAFPPDTIEEAPDIGVRWRSDYITGVIRQDGGFVVLIDIASVLTSRMRHDGRRIRARHDPMHPGPALARTADPGQGTISPGNSSGSRPISRRTGIKMPATKLT
jgi:hypothetical protein